MKKLLILLLFISFSGITQKALAQLDVKAEIRPRAELRNGFKRPRAKNVDPAFFIEQRSRLYFNYLKEKWELQFTLQDVRIWGATSQIYKSDPALTNIYEGWVNYNFTGKWYSKLGRQAVDRDNARFFGDLDWAQQGRSHDLLLIYFENKEKGMVLDIGAAFNQTSTPAEPTRLQGTEYFGVNNYKTMQYLWFHNTFSKGKYSVIVHNEGVQTADTSVANRQTLAIVSDVNVSKKVKLAGEVFYQTGSNRSKTDVSAWLVAVNATFSTKVTPITIGVDFLTGTERDEVNNDKSFVPLYGTNHKFYGTMDYFYVGSAHGQGGNTGGLTDIFLKTKFKTGDKSVIAADIHYFLSPVKVYRDPSPAITETASSGLGTEIDLVYILNMSKNAKLWLGYSHMFATESMVFMKNFQGDQNATQNWAWLMFQFKPTIFTTKNK